jgi:hypothetical protein
MNQYLFPLLLILEDQVITFLYCIRDVVGSNLGKDTNYPERFLEFFNLSSMQISGQYHKIGHDGFLPHLSNSLFAKVKRKRKKGKANPVTGSGGPHIFMAVRLTALSAGRPLPPGRFLVLISVRV